MPVISSTTARKVARAVVLLAVAAVATVVTYRQVTGSLPPLLQSVAPLLILVIVIVLIRMGIAALPARYDRAIFRGRINLLDVVMSIACMLAALSWVAIAVRFVSDTTVGVVTLAIPLFLLLGVGVFFLGRSMFRKSQ